jgi:hypothetical protein
MSAREREGEEEKKMRRMDTNHSQQRVALLLFFSFIFTMRMMMMMMDEGQAYAHTRLGLMRCLYSPRQNANISSILIKRKDWTNPVCEREFAFLNSI